MIFEQGHLYVGGADVPFFVTKSMLVSAGKDNGFDQIQIFDKKDFPFWTLPPGSIPSGVSWNTVARGVRVAPTGNVAFPSDVKWVVDITPAPIVTAGTVPSQPQAQPLPDTTPLPDWVPLPPTRPMPDAGGAPAVNVPTGLKLPLMVGAGVIGGTFFAYQAMNHMFKVGLTDKERRNILLYAASVGALWGLAKLIDVDKAWWASPEGIAERAAQEVGK
jgi:hypothetical protein